MFTKKINAKIASIEKEHLDGIALMGSYAIQEEEQYSDIDIVCFTSKSCPVVEIEIIDHKYIVISFVESAKVEKWFEQPMDVSNYMFGLKNMNLIYDPNNYLKDIKNRAIKFEWAEAFDLKANRIIGQELVSLVEEVNKGIQGLLSDTIGKQLNSVYGLAFGLLKLMRIKKRILIKSENTMYSQVLEAYRSNEVICASLKLLLGIKQDSLKNRTIIGLQLFKLFCNEVHAEQDTKTKEILDIAIININNSLQLI